MNLDLGFETRFYRGMDAYVQTWLQFAFPVYVWILISLIIVASRYSIFLTKLIGSNPIAVLATLLLMSYTKILKIAIEVYTFGRLDYPDNKTVTVWLKDANVPFLQTWHLFLTVVTSCLPLSPLHLVPSTGIQALPLFRKEAPSLVEQAQATTGLLLCPIRETHSLLDRLPVDDSLCSLHCFLT